MRDYKKPEAMYISETSEGVYMASGDDEEDVKRCRFGRTEANPGADTCQVCSYSGGVRDKELPDEPLFKEDYKGCPDNMPEKED